MQSSRASHDEEIRVGARGDRGADALGGDFDRVEGLRLVGVLARAGVVLDVDGGDAGGLESRDCLIERFGIGDDRDPHRVDDGLRMRR